MTSEYQRANERASELMSGFLRRKLLMRDANEFFLFIFATYFHVRRYYLQRTKNQKNEKVRPKILLDNNHDTMSDGSANTFKDNGLSGYFYLTERMPFHWK